MPGLIRLGTPKLFIAAILLAISGGCSEAVHPVAPTAAELSPQQLVLEAGFHHTQLHKNKPDAISSGVSLVRVGKVMLLCGYAYIAGIDSNLRECFVFDPPEGISTKDWRPTGAAYDEPHGLLYVANYNGGGVLVLMIDGTRLTLVRKIKTPSMKGPENVAVSPDGERIAVADYSASALICCTALGQPLWECPIGLCHGVCWDNSTNTILATGLQDRAIYRFSPGGELLRRRGSFGWGRDQYLWPTCVASDSAGVIYVADAHTGRISQLDSQLGQTVTAGGNGAGVSLFNMPYSVTVDGDKLLVCDVFKSRVVVLQRGTMKAIESYGTAKAETDGGACQPLGVGYDGYDCTRESVRYAGFDWTPGYERLFTGTKEIDFNSHLKIWNAENQFYFMQAREAAPGTILVGSPQSKEWLVLNDSTARVLRLGENHWLCGDKLLGAHGGTVSEIAARPAAVTFEAAKLLRP